MEQEEKNNKRQPALRNLRESANLSQEQLAHLLGKSLSTVRRWERGTEPVMSRQDWKKFCELVATNFDDLPDLLASPLPETSSENS